MEVNYFVFFLFLFFFLSTDFHASGGDAGKQPSQSVVVAHFLSFIGLNAFEWFLQAIQREFRLYLMPLKGGLGSEKLGFMFLCVV